MTRVAKSPSMPLYGKDCYDDEAFNRLSFAEQGFYWRLAWWQWQEGSIPAELNEILDRLPRRHVNDARKLWPTIQEWFPIAGSIPNRRQNGSVEDRRQAYLIKKGRQQLGAEITNANRYGKRSDFGSLTDALSDSVNESDSDSPRAASAIASATATVSRSPEEGPGGTKPLTGSQATVKRVLDAWPGGTVKHAALIGKWVSLIGADEVEKITLQYPDKPAAYINQCVESRATEIANGNGRNAASADRRGARGEAGRSAASIRNPAAGHKPDIGPDTRED